ncbi:hypothetical protein [Thalassolituus alkanivorans]|uniref:hypothetical protein n=1 Tax=Thalassolituus alkanivorans TaxID=2881055 RepID=UPI001E34FD77|nr:hypothetical protein [Thalassolituus alkanivorans]MCB2384954.1 hypothetical protein [Thalassolituus alkanivorans]MCB2422042.1 hypothetical protein [Thalassolituus alkanivorans]
MDIGEFNLSLQAISSDEGILDFFRKHFLHGTPHVFNSRDEEYYEFRKKIGDKFSIPFYEIFITGSGKLGFSPFKKKMFDFDSDIDVALVSPKLFESIMLDIANYQMQFRDNRAVVRERELKTYHEFLEYVALGWIRPDKLPISFQMSTFKDDWFNFFRSISNGKSEVGNYQVNAGVFKSYDHLERYTLSGVKKLKRRKPMEPHDDASN